MTNKWNETRQKKKAGEQHRKKTATEKKIKENKINYESILSVAFHNICLRNAFAVN